MDGAVGLDGILLSAQRKKTFLKTTVNYNVGSALPA